MSNLESLEKKLRVAKVAERSLINDAPWTDDLEELEKNKEIIKQRIWNLTVEIEGLKDGIGQ